MSLKRKSIIGILVAAVIIIAIAIIGKSTLTGFKTYTIRKTKFESIITAKGEIQGKNAILISFPDELKHRDLRIHEFQIKDIIQEGSIVKKGDWVASLDKDNITQQIQYNNDDLERRLADFNDAKIDTAIELTNLREEMKEFKYELEYRELELEQAKYESPAYQRKVKVSFNKTVRQIEKKKRDYELRRLYLAARTKRRQDWYNYSLQRDSLLKKALIAADIVAPNDGIMMYARTRNGRKIRVGDHVNQWNPTIATLPDMTTPVSETFIEEIQITKINIGDSATITIDALPGKIYNGVISKIANIGQEIAGFESNVFHVLIQLNGSDPELKPAMTSNNNIIIHSLQDVITIPRECLFAENGNNFVYLKKAGEIYKHPVISGMENETVVVIESGLSMQDKILFSPPEKEKVIESTENIASK
ncbi:MAG: HlyD family efflux transporter periplasmic adaptor subunit [Mariniphaga sp.]|nr:HlyD family efflux transporter periplasmic adaptor subunit [Mariniphaga sp.]MDD4225364.1 HlyD family efflux transporter periplasmic adaptor subunit [Mariniphaga sp.]MDD4424330.1 HlyD family efflux transporter periplasmic adaptor subunit [Mariniphaga sp.]